MYRLNPYVSATRCTHLIMHLLIENTMAYHVWVAVPCLVIWLAWYDPTLNRSRIVGGGQSNIPTIRSDFFPKLLKLESL